MLRGCRDDRFDVNGHFYVSTSLNFIRIYIITLLYTIKRKHSNRRNTTCTYGNISYLFEYVQYCFSQPGCCFPRRVPRGKTLVSLPSKSINTSFLATNLVKAVFLVLFTYTVDISYNSFPLFSDHHDAR